jgi:hypothetical protein
MEPSLSKARRLHQAKRVHPPEQAIRQDAVACHIFTVPQVRETPRPEMDPRDDSNW